MNGQEYIESMKDDLRFYLLKKEETRDPSSKMLYTGIIQGLKTAIRRYERYENNSFVLE